MSEEIEQKANALVKVVDWMIESGLRNVTDYVEKLRDSSPMISPKELAWKIVNRKSLKSGLVGAATGVGGLITLPVTIPADLLACWKIQIFMALAIAKVFGHTNDTTDFKTDVYLILAGNEAKEALKRVGIEVGKGVTKKAINKYITMEVMKKIWSYIPRKILTKAGEKSVTSFMKMVPIVGAPIGFGFDWVTTRGIGKVAIEYYS